MTRWARFGRRRSFGVVAFAALLAGCGGQPWSSTVGSGSSRPAASDLLVESVRSTTAAKTARVALRVSIGAADSPSGLTVSADGRSDFASGDSQFTIQLGGALGGSFAGGIEVRTVAKIVYLQLPAALGGRFGAADGQWLKLDTTKLGPGGSALGGLSGDSDPTKFMAYLEAVSDGVRAVGTETVRGVETTHYEASLDLGKAVDRAQVPPALRDNLRQLLQSMGSAAPVIPADVWVDADGLVRRIQLQLDAASFAGVGGLGAGAGNPTVTVAIDLYDFGVPVHVEAPAADQVIPFGGLGGLGQTDTAPAA